MPRATVKYGFEWKLFAWAGELAQQRTGANRCFLFLPGPDGAGGELLVGEDESSYDKPTWQPIMATRNGWIFYHPFDAPEYTYLEWRGLDLNAIKRATGVAIDQRDLVSGDDRIDFPASWSVMF